MEIIFKGISSTNPNFGIISVTRVERFILPGQRNRFLSIPGRDGVYDFGCDYEMLSIPINFVIQGTSHQDVRQKSREVSLWLECHDLYPLVFGDETDKFYLARPMSPVATRQIHLTVFCSVTFGVPDVFAQSIAFSQSGATGTNNGTLPTPVFITAEITASGSSIRITHQQSGEYLELLRSVINGDVLEIDTGRRIVLLNNIDRRADLAVESNYFKLPATSAFTLQSSVAAAISTEWRERWS